MHKVAYFFYVAYVLGSHFADKHFVVRLKLLAYRAYHTEGCVVAAGGHKSLIFLRQYAVEIVLGCCLAVAAGNTYYLEARHGCQDAGGIIVVSAGDAVFYGGEQGIGCYYQQMRTAIACQQSFCCGKDIAACSESLRGHIGERHGYCGHNGGQQQSRDIYAACPHGHHQWLLIAASGHAEATNNREYGYKNCRYNIGAERSECYKKYYHAAQAPARSAVARLFKPLQVALASI